MPKLRSFAVSIGVWALPALICGQTSVAPARVQAFRPETLAAADVPIDTKADQLNYDRNTGWVTAFGNVVISKGDVRLMANSVRVNVKTQDAHASGNVILEEGESVWRGERLDYNFGTKQGSAVGFTGQMAPFRVLANERVDRVAENRFVFHNATVTTCSNTTHYCHYHVRAREVTIEPGDYMTVRRGVWYFAGVPVMYLPVWTKDLRDDFGWEFRVGHSSRMGASLLSAYRYRINPGLRGRTHLDYRTERGVGVGQDFMWSSLTGGTGDIALYYLNDSDPLDRDDDPVATSIEEDRYRVRLRHYVGLSERDYAMARVNYLSDTDVLDDFFDDEYRDSPVPENYVTFAHRGDWYTASLRANGRLNDFFGGVNRLPEGVLESIRQQLGDSSFYYQGRTALGYLEKVYPETDETEDYSAVRFDSVHTLYRPSRHFGFLTLVPRTGVRGTYYSATVDRQTLTNLVLVTQTNALTGAVTQGSRTNTTEINVETEAVFRTQYEIGLEASFKAFRTWDGGGVYEPVRHVVEPYANYTYLSEPSVLPDELYQFDSIDELDKENFVKLGARNKYQVKRNNRPFDLIYLDLYTRVRFETEEDQETIDDYFMDAEIVPIDWMKIELDGEFDTDENTLRKFNTRLVFSPAEYWRAGIEHRYLVDRNSLLNGTLTLMPNRNWELNAYARYELEESRLEEEGGYIQRNYDCMALRLNGRVRPSFTRSDGTVSDTDYRVTLEFWLTALPEVGVRRRPRR